MCNVDKLFFAEISQVEAELEASRSHIREESTRINSEVAKLRQDQLKVRTESEAVAKERERLDAFAKDVEERSQEAEKLCQVHFSQDFKVSSNIHLFVCC